MHHFTIQLFISTCTYILRGESEGFLGAMEYRSRWNYFTFTRAHRKWL